MVPFPTTSHQPEPAQTKPDIKLKSDTGPSSANELRDSANVVAIPSYTTPSVEPYTEVIPFKPLDEIALFQKRNYKVRLTVGAVSNIMVPTTVVLDTGAGPNLINMDFIKTEWRD